MTQRESSPPANPPLSEGTVVGSYRVLRRVDGDALGVVYEAERTDTARRAALRILDPALLDEAARARFPWRVDSLRALRHPGLAAAIEGGLDAVEGEGEPRTLPWLATERVSSARTILEHARERGLGPRGRLKLLLQACDAIEYAHRRGVRHGDLAPSRLLVDGDGRVRVLDLGVSHLVDPDRLHATWATDAKAVVDTLPYRSPEQLDGSGEDVDTRTDVYALGALGYEILVGHPPIDAQEPAKGRFSRRGDSDLERDLREILRKALGARPEDRYGGVGAFADDIRRFLDDRPVLAHTPGIAYRLRVFARRRPLLAGGMVAALLALGSAIVAVYQGADQAERREQAALDGAVGAAEAAHRARLVLEQLLDRSTLGATRFAPQVERLGGGHGLATAMMQHTLSDLQLVERLSGDDPLVRLALASGYVRFGDAVGSPLEMSLGDIVGAMRAYDHGLGLLDSILAAGPTLPPVRWTALRAHQGRGEALLAQGRAKESIEALDRALALAETLHAEVPVELAFEASRARALHQLAIAWGRAGDLERSAAHLASSREAFTRLVRKDPRAPAYRYFLALGHQQAAATAFSRGEHETAREESGSAVLLLEPLVEGHPLDPRYRESLARNVMWAGRAERALGRRAVARKRLESALRFYRELAEADPDRRETAATVEVLQAELDALAKEPVRGER